MVRDTQDIRREQSWGVNEDGMVGVRVREDHAADRPRLFQSQVEWL